jgi:uncharacterized NAD(P)/FAD-binding protein YdhS
MTTTRLSPPAIEHVAIIGAGFSGTLQAINLLRHDGPRVTLIERREAFARGVAYSTPSPAHLLNVRASNMSALPDDPDHFVRWLVARGAGNPQSFALRRDYGLYLGELLEATRAAAPGRLAMRRDAAAEIRHAGDRMTIGLDSGESVTADAVVLALGNLPPHDPPAFADAALPPDCYIRDPWSTDFTEGLTDEDIVLIIGTGLTMIDVVLTLEASGFGGRIVALSRHGLVPRTHDEAMMPPPAPAEKPAETGSALLRLIRNHAELVGWRAAIDELRPYTQAMWLSAPVEEQKRFLRHLHAWWDVHRHRIAPQVAEQIYAVRRSGRLEIVAGKIDDVALRDGGVTIGYRPRHTNRHETIGARRVINCTGPQGDLLRTREPLLHLLMAAGLIRPDRHRFGIDVNAQAETIGVQDIANPRLLALGSMTRGTFWEIVAVPDIRVQTWAVARRLSNAHWVEGEGL